MHAYVVISIHRGVNICIYVYEYMYMNIYVKKKKNAFVHID
jgi:hypothetical protein